MSKQLLSVIIIMSVVFNAQLFAGDTGKIVGSVTDKKTGEPLIGANVIVVGTDLGAATDENGNYYVLQVPPGEYNIKLTYIGYETVTIKEVYVNADLTTRVDIEVNPTVIEGKEVVVFADQSVVRHDITSTRKTTTRKQFETVPGLESSSDIFKLRGGVFQEVLPEIINIGGTNVQVRDESLQDIHIRGGRGGEILYMIDGMPVSHPIYGGRNVIDLNLDDVEFVELISGAFSAEYGQAQSGVVNITTRSGSEDLHFGIQLKSDEAGNIAENHNEFYLSSYLQGRDFLLSGLLNSIGIGIPGKMLYFVSTNATLTNTAYNNNRSRSDISYMGLKFRERQDNTINLNGRLDWHISSTIYSTLSYHGNYKRWSNFDWLWKYYPDHIPVSSRESENFNLKINYTLSRSTFFSVNIGYLGLQKKTSLDGKSPYDFWIFYSDSADHIGYDYYTWKKLFPNQTPYRVASSISPPTFDTYTHFYDSTGYECPWIDERARSSLLKTTFTSQITDEHLIKTGLEMKYDDIRFINIADGGVKKSDYGEYLYPDPGKPTLDTVPPPIPSGPYKEFGQTRWIFNAYPVSGSYYLQDKYERRGYGLIINAGFRIDWFLLGPTVETERWKREWEYATGLESNWKRLKYKISPRFGISFPISERNVVFFSYGHFCQLPEIHYFYRDPYTGGITGNPHLDFEQTILYEFGFTQRINRYWFIDIKSYNKDISDQIGLTELLAARGLSVTIPDNKSYQRAKGLEFELRKIYSRNTSGTLTYTVQWANGYSSSAFDDYIRSLTDFPYPIRERRVNYDIRHQIVFSGTIESSKTDPADVFGIRLPVNWDLTVLFRFASGRPYTPFTTNMAEAQKLENTAEMPPTSETDLKFNKHFSIFGVNLTIFVDIFNLFNQYNITGASFNTETGKPYRYGDKIEGTNIVYSWRKMYSLLTPFQFSEGRHIKFGLKLRF